MTDKNLFEIVDGRLVSFKGDRDEAIDELDIPAEVTCIGENVMSFAKCRHVRFLGNVTKIERWAFSSCPNLLTVEIPEGVKVIEPYAFSDCNSLLAVTIPDGVEEIGKFAFAYDVSLKKLDIPASVTKIDPSAFVVTNDLSEICVDEKNPTYMSIDGNVYTRDGKTLVSVKTVAKEIDIPESVTEIGDYAFVSGDIVSVCLPAGVTRIGEGAFHQCWDLETIEIPAGVKAIDDFAFYECRSLKSIYYGGTREEWEAISVGSDNSALNDAKVYFNSKR